MLPAPVARAYLLGCPAAGEYLPVLPACLGPRACPCVSRSTSRGLAPCLGLGTHVIRHGASEEAVGGRFQLQVSSAHCETNK